LQDGGVVVAGERLGALVHRLGLGLADRQGRGGLRLTLGAQCVGLRRTAGLLGLAAAGTLDRLGLGERGATGLLGLTVEAGLLRGRLGGSDGGGLAGVGGGDLRAATGLGLLLDPVALGVGGLADLRLEVALGQRGPTHGDLLLLGEDRLVAVGLGQRAGRGGVGLGGIGLGLDLGLLQRQRALGDRDLLLGDDARLLRGLARRRLGHRRLLLDPRRLGPTQIGEVGA